MVRKSVRVGAGVWVCWVLLSIGLGLLLAARAKAETAVERGRVLFALAGGCGCHTSKDGPVGAGGGEVPTPFGKFYGTNITPDPETGIGKWSDQEIIAAIRDGVARGKGVESPAMPYYWYAGMSDEDVRALVAYLRSLPAVRQPNRPHEGEPPFARLAYRAWRALWAPRFRPAPVRPSDPVERGRYFVDHVSLCADCHTPRNFVGAIRFDLYLAGTEAGPGGTHVPNITPHETGIGSWDEDDIVNLLRTGFTPEFDNVQGWMAEVVEGKAGGPGYRDAPEEELRAIARYLRQVRPIAHRVERD
ncbi:MAG: cytochrome c [Candidatus Binatia bacterium]|nr:cytochrome c [Candidatus Binatia bacterium]